MKVSVIIPVYNACRYLQHSIESAISQPEVAEVIVVDDHSSDESLVIAQKMQLFDSRIRIIKNDTSNYGAGAARNVGVDAASSEWIAFLDADDFYLPGRFAYTSEIDINPECEAIYCGVSIEASDGMHRQILHGNYISGYVMRSGMPGTWVNMDLFLHGGGLHLNGLTLKRELFLKIGGFDEQLLQAQDTDFIFRLLLDGKIWNADSSEPGAIYRVHDDNTILNIREGIYFRRMAALKHLKLSIRHRLSIKTLYLLLKKYVEFDYLLLIHDKKNSYKRLAKSLLLPVIIFRIFFKTGNPPYRNR